jgi:dTMP kinase
MIRLKKGILIVFEGIDGAGKTTQAEALRDRLYKRGLKVLFFREPSEGKWGRIIRQKAAQENSLSPEEELDLFQKDRQENVNLNLKPALKAKNIVLLDRYYFSTMAYQGAKGIDPEFIRSLNQKFVVEPDLVFIMDIEADKGLSRIQNRKNRDLLFEREDYLVRVREIFHSIQGENITHIDARLPQHEITDIMEKEILEYIEPFMEVDD